MFAVMQQIKTSVLSIDYNDSTDCYIKDLKKIIQALGFANWERNESGHVLSKWGISIEMMDWLSLSMKFE